MRDVRATEMDRSRRSHCRLSRGTRASTNSDDALVAAGASVVGSRVPVISSNDTTVLLALIRSGRRHLFNAALRSIAISASVCLSARVSQKLHVTKLSVRVTRDHGCVFL